MSKLWLSNTLIVMIPKNLKDWNFVKDKVHDISGIKDSPESYYYQCNNDVYYPVVRVYDMEKVNIK